MRGVLFLLRSGGVVIFSVVITHKVAYFSKTDRIYVSTKVDKKGIRGNKMGVNLKAKTKGLKYGEREIVLGIAGFGALKEFAKTTLKSEQLEQFFSAYRALWSAEDTKTIAELLNKVTLKQVAEYKKASRDEAVKSPIITCGHCDGVGTTELDSFGKPQYIGFCKECQGLGVTRNTFDLADYVDLTEIKRVAVFLEKSGGVSVS